MNWIIRLIGTAVVVFVLLEIFYTAQKYAESKGKPKSLWIHAFFWGLWSIVFLICMVLFLLILWVGIHMYLENDYKDALLMVIIAFLIGSSNYILFLYPLQKRWKGKIKKKREG